MHMGGGVGYIEGVVMEIVLTFSLVFTVYGTAVDPKRGSMGLTMAPLCIALIVGANIMAGGPFSGASMNPARSFGPAFVMWQWREHWVYWVGPLVGGGLPGALYDNFFIIPTYEPLPVTCKNTKKSNEAQLSFCNSVCLLARVNKMVLKSHHLHEWDISDRSVIRAC